MRMRMDGIACAVPREDHGRQMEVATDALENGPKRFFCAIYRSRLDE